MSAPGQSPSVLRDLQEAISGHLRVCSGLSGIDVLDRRDATIEDKIANALAGPNGVAIFVSPILPKGFSANYPAPCFDRGDFTVRVLENPTNNGSGRDAYALAETVIRRLHHWTPGVQGAGVVTVDEDPLDDNSTKKAVIFDILFHLSCSFEAGAD